MRQLVSVVTDESIAYLVHDGEHTTQIAQVMNVGLDVQGVITLGVNLGDVLRLPTLKLNGHAERVVEPAQRRELPPAKTAAPKRYKLKADHPVTCTVCGRPIKRRHGYAPHLMSIHRWSKPKALLEARTCPSSDETLNDAPRGRPSVGEVDTAREVLRGPKGRAIPAERIAVADTWPHCEPSDVYAFIAAHPEGVSTRDIALALADESQRGRQTIGNRLQTLFGQGLISKTDELRPHYRSGTPTKTMIVRIKR